MKKVILLIIALFIMTGCSNINKAEIEDLIKEVQSSKLNLTNQFRTGYKYFLPVGLNLRETTNLNEIFETRDYSYFLFVDLVSYYNKAVFEFEVDEDAYISMDISHNDIQGYLTVKQKGDKYLIEIMYNYAKIEVVVDESYLREAIVTSIVILSTIKFNDDIINNMMGDNIFEHGEEQLSIFKNNQGEGNFIELIDEYDAYDGDALPDPDRIN